MSVVLLSLTLAFLKIVHSQTPDPDPHDWQVIEGSCTATCGIQGFKPTLVICNHPDHGTKDETSCGHVPKPTPEFKPCNRRSCGGTWNVGPFGACSSICYGNESREVFCEERSVLNPNQPVSAFGDLTRVGDERCREPKPAATKPCGLQCVKPRIATTTDHQQSFPVPYGDASYSVGQSVYVHRGRRLSIDAVVVEGLPTPNLTWTLPDGTELPVGQASGSHQVLANGTLIVSTAGDGDGGTYTATAVNVFGQDAKTSKVTVVCRPRIIVSRESPSMIPADGDRYYAAGATMIIQQGGDLYVDVNVDPSCPNVNYTWTLPGGDQLRQGGTSGAHRVLNNGTLVVRSVDVSQSGTQYRAEIDNIGGTDSAASTLRVVCRPEIVIPPSPPYSLPDSDRYFAAGQNWVVRQGFSLQSDVFTKPGCPVVNYTWTLPAGNRLQSGESSDKYSVLSNGSLVIDGADMNDRGQYAVEIAGSGGSDSAVSNLDVICRPRIIPGTGTLPGLPDSDRYFDLGQAWTIRVGNDVHANVIIDPQCPDVNITWQLPNGNQVKQGESVNGVRVLSNGTLVLGNAQLADAGAYRATATTPGGSDSAESELSVICRPDIIPGVGTLPGLPDADRYAVVGQEWVMRKGFNLQADVVINPSCPEVNISWVLPSGERVNAGETSGRFSVMPNGSLVISGAELADAGQYRAEARTIGGSDFAVSPLRVICRPKIIPATGTLPGLPSSDRYFGVGQRWRIRTGFKVYGDVEIDPECPDVQISWRLPSGDRLRQGESDGDYEVLSNGTLVISNAKLSDAGRYRATATTEGGTDHASSQLTVICSPDIIPVPGSIPGLPFSDRSFSAGQQWVVRTGYGLKADVVINPNCPNVDISWTLANGATVGAGETSGKFRVLPNGTLYIENAALSDAGMYRVVASNEGGTDDATSPLTVICQPKILPGTGTLPGLPDSDRYFVLGQQWIIRDQWTLQADVNIDPSCPTTNITWQLANGNSLKAGDKVGKYSALNNGTLVIEKTSLTDIGTYTARAQTPGGTDSASSPLTVICRPQIIPGTGFLPGLPESDRYFVVGESNWNIRTGYVAYADVIINQSCPEVDITWQLPNGNDIKAGQTDGKFQVLANGTLVINNVQLGDRGNYRATATNRGGSSSAASPLSVGCRPRISSAPTLSPDVPDANRNVQVGQNWVIRRGRSLTASVVVDDSCPEVTFRWQLPNGDVLNSGRRSGKYRVRSDGRLVINNAQVADEGTYTAIVESSGGRDTASSPLSVIFPPQLVEPPPVTDKLTDPIPVGELNSLVGQRVRTRPGQNVTIEARIAEARPQAEIEWTFPNGSTLKTNSKRGRFEVTSDGSLIIRNVKDSDKGSYSARAANGVGTDEETTEVIVIPKPIFEGTPDPSTGGDPSAANIARVPEIVEAGNDVSLIAKLESLGSNLTVVNWTLPDGRTLAIGETLGKFSALSSSTLTITNIQPQDAGSYVATATNPAGFARKIFDVRVIDYTYEVRQGACTATCGSSGVQISTAVCVSQETRRRVDETKCIVAERRRPAIPPPIPCNRVLCDADYKWDTDDWGPDPCSPSCTSYQTRRVSCLQTLASMNATVVADIECVGYPKPLDRRLCNEQAECTIPPKFRLPPPIVMPLNKSTVYNRYDLYQNVIGVEGRYLYVDAVLAQGSPPPDVQWTFPDMTYLDSGQSRGRFTVFSNGTLRITNAQYSDQGMYRTTARNVAGWDQVVSPFTIYVPPKITSHKVYRSYRPKDVDPQSSTHMVRPGEKVAIQCRYWGSPNPVLSWTHDGVPVKFDHRVKVDNTGCLIISDVRLTDTGTYQCVASNIVGVDRKNVTLTVESLEANWVRVVPPCPVTCGRGTVVVTSECRSTVTNTQMDSLECQELRRPLSYRTRCNSRSCPATSPAESPAKSSSARWSAGSFGACTECTKKREVLCTVKNKGEKQQVSPLMCVTAGRKPKEERHCTNGGQWVTSTWSKCSNTCGKRSVKCIDPCREGGKGNCSKAGPKPDRYRACNEVTCKKGD